MWPFFPRLSAGGGIHLCRTSNDVAHPLLLQTTAGACRAIRSTDMPKNREDRGRMRMDGSRYDRGRDDGKSPEIDYGTEDGSLKPVLFIYGTHSRLSF